MSFPRKGGEGSVFPLTHPWRFGFQSLLTLGPPPAPTQAWATGSFGSMRSLSLSYISILGPSNILLFEVTPDRRLSNTDPRGQPWPPVAHGPCFSWMGFASASPQRASASPRLFLGFLSSSAPRETGCILHRQGLCRRHCPQLLCSFSILQSDVLLE